MELSDQRMSDHGIVSLRLRLHVATEGECQSIPDFVFEVPQFQKHYNLLRSLSRTEGRTAGQLLHIMKADINNAARLTRNYLTSLPGGIKGQH
eukprot:9232536-Pyramimonas_sp.AAC.1